ncbi:hypothetical protein ATJ97_0200 [Georgenia soli]|uniref:Uncharacterized protein n=1 Tax=Georgenia soli TaxID=638953 RepID=A0A2A9F286_9MICO|nr:hypothetical protein [Georgenia soli]PFG44926.1 hypothetical protein ATJ97_0200 [Georgenia soli]
MPLESVPDDEGAHIHTLTPEQYGEPVKMAERPVPALAWIRNRDGHHRLMEVVATAWTPRAVQVRYTDGNDHVPVVWLSARSVLRLGSSDE